VKKKSLARKEKRKEKGRNAIKKREQRFFATKVGPVDLEKTEVLIVKGG